MQINAPYNTEKIEGEMGGLECEEQMYLASDWKAESSRASCSPLSYRSDDDRTPSPPMYPGSSGTPSPPQYGSPCSSESNHYPMYTTLESSHVVAMDNLGFETDPLTWRDRQPCMWTQNDVIMWLIHLNQNPQLPTRCNNKDLEIAAFANMTGADLVQMRCDEYLKCDPANAMFIYLALQAEINNKQPMRPQDFSMPITKLQNYAPTPNPSPDTNSKLESLDLKLVSFDTDDTFNSIRSIKNEPESLPTMAQFQNYQPEMTPTPSPQMSPQSESGMPPQPMYYNQSQHDQRFYHQYYQPLAYSPYGAGHINGYNMTEIKGNHLWEFVRDLLLDTRYNPSIIRWEDREKGIFRFVKSDHVAKLWGLRKNNPAMTYEKLSRAMRYYYQRKILERIDGKRLVYKFGSMATGWKNE